MPQVVIPVAPGLLPLERYVTFSAIPLSLVSVCLINTALTAHTMNRIKAPLPPHSFLLFPTVFAESELSLLLHSMVLLSANYPGSPRYHWQEACSIEMHRGAPVCQCAAVAWIVSDTLDCKSCACRFLCLRAIGQWSKNHLTHDNDSLAQQTG